MSRTNRVWQHADRAFGHADAAFKEADKAFAEADQLFNSTEDSIPVKPGVHRLKFEARNWPERWRLTRRFFKLALVVLFTGKAKLSFKDR